MPRRLLTAASLLLLLVAVSGCDPEPDRSASMTARTQTVHPAPSGSVAPPNGVDLLFAKMMVAHHAQAVSMSRTLLAKQGIPERAGNVAGYIEHD